MNPKSKIRFYLGLLSIVCLLLVGCRTTSKRNYFDSKFECYAESGWRDKDKFQKYIENAWLPTRLLYQSDNVNLKQSRIVFTGNSLVQLFVPELMQKEFPGERVVNRGIGGDMTETLLTRIEDDVLVLQPDIIVIEIGGNDMIQGKCLSIIQNNVLKIVEKIQASKPQTQIYFMAVPPTRVRELNQIVPVFNLFLNQIAYKYKNVKYIEVWDVMRDVDSPTLREEYIRPNKDPLHFNEKGYEVWGEKLRPYLKK